MKIEELFVTAYIIPTETPESDGTLIWNKTTMIVVEARADRISGVGYTYGSTAAGVMIREVLAEVVTGLDPMDISAAWGKMLRQVRNDGATGISAMAISAVDNALWDLKARLLGLSLSALLGTVRSEIPVYGSGGFTSYSNQQLEKQLKDWIGQGIKRVKIKVGREPDRDVDRVKVARKAIGTDCELFVDANSAYDRKQALSFIERFVGDCDVRWMEQPLPPEDFEGMRFLRERAPAALDIADGEYAYRLSDFQRMITEGAVDVMMADATRCCGISGFLQAASLCEATKLPISSHCAPLLHLHLGCAIQGMRHLEYFHDHVRIERMFFDGMPEISNGHLKPQTESQGLGVTFRRSDAEPYRHEF